MKKQVKKMVLAKETVRSLEVAVMAEVVGGSNFGNGCDGTGSCRICLPDSNQDVC
jgi:hypothetical protein